MSAYTPVTAPEILYQTPGETRTRSGDFTADLESGETLSSGAGCTATPAGLTITNVQIVGNKVAATIAGTAGSYLLTFSVTTSLSQVKQVYGRLNVVTQ